MKGIVPTVGVLVFKNDSVLLVCHKEGASHLTDTCGLQSGRIKESESEKEAAVRELLEETGLVTQAGYLIEFPHNFYQASIERKEGEVTNFSWRVFLVQQFSGELKESEETKPEWVSVAEIGRYNLLSNVYDAIQAGLKF